MILDRFPIGPLQSVKDIARDLIARMFQGASVLQLAVISLAAGLGEEVLFRGLAQAGLAKLIGGNRGVWIALVGALRAVRRMSLAEHDLRHPGDAGGLYFGLLLMLSGSLWTPIVAHAAYDLIALVYLFASAEPDTIERNQSGSRCTHPSSYFVSDLHLFSRRSLAPRHEAAMHAAAARAHTFVLGGDIFDFRWSHFHSPEETARQAVRWLDDLVASHPRCDFHFVQGNHDCNRPVRLGPGDAIAPRGRICRSIRTICGWAKTCFCTATPPIIRRCVQPRLHQRREHWSRDESARRDASQAVRPGRHGPAASAGRQGGPSAAARRASNSRLPRPHRPQAREQGVEHVYFGHTHDALENYRHGGVTFHNPGAPIAGPAVPDRGNAIAAASGDRAVAGMVRYQ